MKHKIFEFYVLLDILAVACLFQSCSYQPFPDWFAPIKVKGYLHAAPNEPAENVVIDVFQRVGVNTAESELVSHGSVSTDSKGYFEFEYNRSNKRNGKKACGLFCELPCNGLELQMNDTVIAACLKTNKKLELDMYLSNTVDLTLIINDTILDGDTLYVSLPPIDVNHESYVQIGETEALMIPGPVFGNFSLTYRTRMSNARYEGWNDGLRGNSYYFSTLERETYQWTIDELQFIGDPNSFRWRSEFDLQFVRFKGEPFTDRLELRI